MINDNDRYKNKKKNNLDTEQLSKARKCKNHNSSKRNETDDNSNKTIRKGITFWYVGSKISEIVKTTTLEIRIHFIDTLYSEIIDDKMFKHISTICQQIDIMTAKQIESYRKADR